ncbi:MAG: hypothetical protein RL653_3200 [Pseudomonadota bacterium]|jgi:pSer/pThr/pTyr-binding forkhead associated (FHA) protein
MGFQLTISEGKEAGKEFVFEQASVTIGRESGCDVAVYDAGVSRKHARIFLQDGVLYVEDLGSSNGTLLNGERISEPTELQAGDALTTGPVVFSFSPTELPEQAGPPQGEGSTRIVSMDEIRRQRNRGSALVPTGAQPAQLQELGRQPTTLHKAASKRPGSAVPERPAAAAGRGGVPSRPGAAGRAGPPARGGRQPPQGPTAAERLRQKREGKDPRVLAAAGVGVLLLLGVGGFFALRKDEGEGPIRGAEPESLSREPITDSFGLGDGVTFPRPDSKTFTLSISSPGEVVALLHFQSADVEEREVSIIVNGVDLGFVPADRLGSELIHHEMLIPAKMLKRGEPNTLIFDNVKNPPGQETWRVWNLWAETVGIPTGSPEELLARAQESFRRGTRAMEGLDIGMENRYRAWREFRTAWLSLEGLPEKPDLHGFARDKVKEAQKELDTKCNAIMLKIRNLEIDPATKDWERVKLELKSAREYFPEKDQPCYWRLREKMDEYGVE